MSDLSTVERLDLIRDGVRFLLSDNRAVQHGSAEYDRSEAAARFDRACHGVGPGHTLWELGQDLLRLNAGSLSEAGAKVLEEEEDYPTAEESHDAGYEKGYRNGWHDKETGEDNDESAGDSFELFLAEWIP